MNAEYIYLLQEREFVHSKEQVIKVGKTKQKNGKRFCQYPKGTVLLLQIICQDCDKTERTILTKFQTQYKQRKDIGSEYFEGDYQRMICDIYGMVMERENEVEVQRK